MFANVFVFVLFSTYTTDDFTTSALQSIHNEYPQVSAYKLIHDCQVDLEPSVYALYKHGDLDKIVAFNAFIPWRTTSFRVNEVYEVPHSCIDAYVGEFAEQLTKLTLQNLQDH